MTSSAVAIERFHRSEEDLALYEAASFWERLCAMVIDGFCISLLSGPVAEWIHPVVLNWLAQDAFMHTASLLIIAMTLPSIAVVVVPTWLWGQSPGKMVLGIRVVDASYRSHVSLLHVLVREFPGKLLSTCLLNAGYLMVFFTGHKRALHDFIGHTAVIRYRNN